MYSTAYLGKLLALAGKQYFAQLDIANMFAMEMYDIQASRRLSAGMTGYEVRGEYLYGQLSGISEGSLYIDIDANTMTATALDGNKETEREFMAVTGMMSSLYESVVWEQLTGIESVSTMSLLGKAQEEGVDICILTQENISSELERLAISDSLKEDLRAEVASGKIVVIPAKELSVNDWNGTGYIVLDPSTGAGSYMINGGLTGGETSGGAVTGVVTFEMLLGLICSAYVQVASFAGIAATLKMMVGAPLITVVGGYILTAMAIVSTYVTFAMTYELILAYTDFMATGDFDSANEVVRISQNLQLEAFLTIFLQLLSKALMESGNGGGNSGSNGNGGNSGSGGSSGNAGGSGGNIGGSEGGLNSINKLDDLLVDPSKLAGVSGDELYEYLIKNGYDVKPLSKGSYKGIPFEEGGGFKVNWGGDRILQYHPADASHHGGAYFKISSGETGTIRIDLDGNIIE